MGNSILFLIFVIVLVVAFIVIPVSVSSLNEKKREELANKNLLGKILVYFSFPFILFGEILGSMASAVIMIFIKLK